jgi:pantetheine-phosphate adenylyltransferase
MRVTGGELVGRRLQAAPGRQVRPTADRVREALFQRLGDLDGCRVLDLFAGTGSLGIEALSRRALRCVFVERQATALGVLRANLAGLELGAKTRILASDVRVALRRLGRETERFDLVLVDPPYGSQDAQRTLESLVEAGVLALGATVVLESSRREPPLSVAGLAVLDQRRYGDTMVTRLVAPEATGRDPRGDGMADGRRIGLFAASFDPVTNGHLDLVFRARRVFDEVVVAVGRNISKEGTFSLEERLGMLEEVLAGKEGIRITSFEGLVTDYARKIGATAVIRGLRAMSDFEYEFEMALMNRHLHPELDTLFMMTDQNYLYVSSSRLKELARFGGDIQDFVPEGVAKKLREKAAKP